MRFTAIRLWAPPIVGVGLFVSAAVFASVVGTQAASRIRSTRVLGVALDEVAGQALLGVQPSQDVAGLVNRRAEMERRITDAQKPALLVAELTEATRRVGVVAREISPVYDRPPAPGGVPVFPRMRVSVTGNYRQIAELLDVFSSQRLPVRVTDFSIDRGAVADGPPDALKADIIVECFQFQAERLRRGEVTRS